MKEQKFVHGDLVRIAKVFRPSMSHFTSDQQAYVDFSFAERYGSLLDSEHQYSVFLTHDMRSSAWYPEDSLTLVEPAGPSARNLLKKRIAKAIADFEKEKVEMLKQGLVPSGNKPGVWERA